jgi:hypothetical protein
VVGAQAAQLGQQRLVARIEAERLGGERRDDLRQRFQQIRIAGGGLDIGGTQDLDGCGAFRRVQGGGTCSGDDDGVELVGGSAAVRRCRFRALRTAASIEAPCCKLLELTGFLTWLSPYVDRNN